MSEASCLTILVVDDQAAARTVLSAMLAVLGHQAIEASDAPSAVALFRRRRPDAVLLDVVMPGHDGYWAARQMRAAESGSWTPIIFLSGSRDEQDLCRSIDSGGDDYLSKPVSRVVLEAKLRAMLRLKAMQRRLMELTAQLRRTNAQLQDLSERDSLTGLANRRMFDRRLDDEIAEARRSGQPLTVMLCDVDRFRQYNDSLGLVQGDECLRNVGHLLATVCQRTRDFVARYGSEEFALILPATPKSGAMTYARALQRMLQQLAIPHPASDLAEHVTISGGITTCVPDADTHAEAMVVRADQALFAAKHQGRNRFFSFEMQIDTEERTAM